MLLGRLVLALVLTALAAATTATMTASAQQSVVQVGIASSSSDAPIFIGEAKGYFRDEGIEVKTVTFGSASHMVAPLGAGQLDVGGGSPSAGLYNAVARGIKIKIVADKASSQPGYGVNHILVRKDLIATGRYKTPADFKGMTVALAGNGVSSMTTLNETIRPFGVEYSQVHIVDLSFPQQVIALRNKAIDAAIATDPSATLAVRENAAEVIRSDDQVIPGHQIAVLLFSEKFALQEPERATRFMRAYLRAARFYNGALRNGRFAGPNADEVIAILTRSTTIKSAEVFKAITPNGCNPDGYVNVPSLKRDLAFYREQGLVKGDVSVEQVVDSAFVDAALKALGPYRPDAASR